MPTSALTRPDPDQLLRRVQAEEEYLRRGRLKIFLGYASGVGKSFRMLDEGRRRRERGQDVVVGAIQPVIEGDISRLLQKLEVIPLKRVAGVDTMDVDTILQRHPQVCLVDGLAHDNPPGSRHPSRWEDVDELLSAEISVVTTINLGYIAELQDEVARIRNKRVEQSVPIDFIRRADEIVLVDAPPDAHILHDYASGETQAQDIDALRHRSAQLREIALVLAADVVDRQLECYLERNGIKQSYGTQERVLICLTPRANAARMLEMGGRIRDGFHGELVAAYVEQPQLAADQRSRLEANLELARAFGVKVERLEGDPIDAILEFADKRGITQVLVGHSMRDDWKARLIGTPLDKLLRKRRGFDVRVFPQI
jgi:two-component system, OmpR family, sensor histidine kinase KdpD